MNTKLIKFFNAAIIEASKLDPIELNIKAAKVGYIVHPDCCNESVNKFIEDQAININSTFYKTWQQVTNMLREELYIDQLIHYASTYGTEYEGETYTKNPNPINIEYNTYKVILPISRDELWKKCYNIVCSGIALNEHTCSAICDYIWEWKEVCGKDFNIDNVKNREAVTIFCDKFNIFPKDPISLLRYIVYKSTNQTTLIKDDTLIGLIKIWGESFDWSMLTDEQLKSLSTIFYRFKRIFLAYKSKNNHNNNVINKIRRYAKKYHKPMVKGILEDITSNVYTPQQIEEAAKSASNFKIIQILQSIAERTHIWVYGGKDMYIIRNGKVYIKEKNHDSSMAHHLNIVFTKFWAQLINNLRDKACVVKFPKNLELSCPVSEKKFIGNIPYGSCYKMDNHNFIGIYWKNEWGTKDFDLSLISEDGVKYGWNSEYFNANHSVIYSGDMTNADPEASEILYCDKKCPNGVIKVNRYNGVNGSKYKLFFGTEKINNIGKNYMVDPNNIKFEEMMTSENTEQAIGYVFNNNIYFMDYKLGSSRVSDKNEFADIIGRKSQSTFKLKNVLIEAGFQEYNPEIHEKIDLDLTDLNKDTLINIFS